MDQPFIPNPTLDVEDSSADALQAAQTLGALLRQTQEYERFLKALKAVNSDLTIQKLAAEIRSHQTALQWDRDPDGQHAAEFARLELEMEDLPRVKEYHQAETVIQQLFRAVDAIVSQEAGLEFAVNAQRSGCAWRGQVVRL